MSEKTKEVLATADAPKHDPQKVLAALPPEDRAIIDIVQPGGPEVNDNDVLDMSGLFAHGDEPDNPAEPAPAPAGEPKPAAPSPADKPTSPAELPAAKTYRVGKKEFTSPDALAAYVDGLEQSKLDLLDQMSIPEAPKPPEIDPGDLVFEDPKKALKMVKDQALAEIRAEQEAERRMQKQRNDQAAAEQRATEQFYRTNPDLVGFEDMVLVQAQKFVAESKNYTQEDAFRIVAERARTRKAEMRKNLIPDQALPVGPAIVASATIASVPTTPVVEAPSSFISELKNIRKRGSL